MSTCLATYPSGHCQHCQIDVAFAMSNIGPLSNNQKPDHLHPLVLRPPGLGVWSGENVQLLGPVGSLHIIKGSSTSLLHSLRLLLYIIRAIDTLFEQEIEIEICNTERYNKERSNTERFNQERCNEERCWHFLGIREPAVLIQCIDVQFTVFGCIRLSFVFLLWSYIFKTAGEL